MKNNMEEIKLNEMEQVNGGYIFAVFEGYDDWGARYTYEVIEDKTGNVLASFDERFEAKDYAWEHGQSYDRIDWPQLKKLREEAGIY